MARDITLIPALSLGPAQRWRLYYFSGNFFYPLTVHPIYISTIRRAIKKFMKKNREMIRRDRTLPDFLTRLELFDLQASTNEAISPKITLKRIECDGVGDNNGFYEAVVTRGAEIKS